MVFGSCILAPFLVPYTAGSIMLTSRFLSADRKWPSAVNSLPTGVFGRVRILQTLVLGLPIASCIPRHLQRRHLPYVVRKEQPSDCRTIAGEEFLARLDHLEVLGEFAVFPAASLTALLTDLALKQRSHRTETEPCLNSSEIGTTPDASLREA